MTDVGLTDKSSDRKYFTMVPNIIANCSSAYEQALYLVIKRIAGEHGTCYVSQHTLAKKLNVSSYTINKTIKKLEGRGWIKKIGVKKLKTRPVNEYEITDIWRENTLNYEKDNLGSKQSPQDEIICLANKDNLSSKHKEEYINKKNINNNIIKPKQKKYSSLKDITEEDMQEIADNYRVPLNFVKMQLEILKNYCEAKGRQYKNYKAALRNFVISEGKRQIERKVDDKYRPIDARHIK